MPKKQSGSTAQTKQPTVTPPNEIRIGELKFARNKGTIPIWVDSMRIMLRADDPIATLVFYSTIPEEMINEEVVRLQTSHKHVQHIVDVLCRSLDYYPEKPQSSATID